jgi:hypothetical protein
VQLPQEYFVNYHHRIIRVGLIGAVGILSSAGLVACGSDSSNTPAQQAPTTTEAMMEETPTTEAMMEETPTTEAMMEETPTTEAMMEETTAP